MMEEYLRLLLEQVRCKKAHALIEDEIRAHMEDQIEDNIANGMQKEMAEMAAVRDMGDPVETGISLDRVHRPAMAWDMIFFMAIISIVGIVIHSLIGDAGAGSNQFMRYTVVGFVVMLIVYRVDYSFMARHAKCIGTIFLTFLFCSVWAFGMMVNGNMTAVHIAEFRVNYFCWMMLYVPIYGAILYQYHGTGKQGILKSLVWMMIPVIFALRLPNLVLAEILFVSMSVLLSIAVYKGWFQVSKKKFFFLFWGSAIVLPIILLILSVAFHWLTAYQEARLLAILRTKGENYITNILKASFGSSFLAGGNSADLIKRLPNFNNDYIFGYLISSYGILAGIAVGVVLSFIVIRCFHISFKQKNQLGMMMGCGCSMVFFVNIALNILENIGLFPITQTFLPFFSAGGSCIITSYILMGTILSIYRYKNILPIHISKLSRQENAL
ncbi:MAG: FtsW/RodA/SpoVE family cell cycle protein [Lachnospiraceae bacterium]|nr:FtsW/RodA/SpoVE family cell cycle protein [Lachnospiraceae bacterium]